jgi:hypothetical protein
MSTKAAETWSIATSPVSIVPEVSPEAKVPMIVRIFLLPKVVFIRLVSAIAIILHFGFID